MTPEPQTSNHVGVQIITTSGNFPDRGFGEFNSREMLRAVLKQAAAHLKLHNTQGWIARLGNRQLNPDQSLAQNQVPNDSKIFWGPAEPGGGAYECILN
jgi:hypothetical protein